VLDVRLEAESLALIEATPGTGGGHDGRPSLRPVADMYVLVRGLGGSMAQLPRASRAASSGRRIEHPGYSE